MGERGGGREGLSKNVGVPGSLPVVKYHICFFASLFIFKQWIFFVANCFILINYYLFLFY